MVLIQPDGRACGGRSQVAQLGKALRLQQQVRCGDVLLLPELVGGDNDCYELEVRALAKALKAWVVGGSHRKKSGRGMINAGLVVDPSGQSVVWYEKANPYGNEIARGTVSGTGPATFEVGGVRCLVAICADFWHRETLQVPGRRPEIILVPALSVTRRPRPELARARWRHLAITRAYEFASYVAISDWAYSAAAHGCASSGVAGLAHPNPNQAALLFRAVGARAVRAFELDLASLEELRSDQTGRGFDLAGNAWTRLTRERR